MLTIAEKELHRHRQSVETASYLGLPDFPISTASIFLPFLFGSRLPNDFVAFCLFIHPTDRH